MSREMKESALPWVGNIPSNWRLGRIKHIYSVTLGKMISPLQTESEQTLENYLCAANIKWSGVDTSVHKQMWFNKSEKEQYLLEDGDVLIMEGGTVGTTTIYHNEFSPCYIQNSVHKCRGKDMIANKFLYYWMQVVQSSGYIDTVCNKATIQHYTKDKVKETPCILVPEDEQHAIVRYLDAKCAAIDEAIERHKKIIEKLEEYKSSVGSWAVLHGIDNNSPIKPSGVEWVSDIPSSWEMKRGKYLFCEISARSEEGKEELLTVSQYTGITPRSQKNVTMFEAESLVGYKICEIGDIPANTMWLWAGAIGVSKYYGVISPSYNIYRQTAHAYDSDYLDYMLRAVPLVQHYKANSTGIRPSRLRLYPPQFLDIKFPVPPINEQKKIVSFLNAKFNTVDNALSRANQMIAKLEEYRKSIIYNAVTGKIDCKEAVK